MKAEVPGPHLQSSALAGTPPIPPLRESGCARTVVARAYLILEMKELKPVPGQELSLVLPVRRIVANYALENDALKIIAEGN